MYEIPQIFSNFAGMNINGKTWEFVRQHDGEDVRKVALLGCKDEEVDLTVALQQIAGRQTARRKLPTWAKTEGIIYPPHLNMEQCSSEQTARYKSGLAAVPPTHHAPTDGQEGLGGTFIDLTGGFGVDFYWMSQGFARRVYVEQNAGLCAVAEQNFQLLGLACSVCCCDTATYLAEMEGRADVVYLDPARRNEQGGRTYGIEDCTPNVLELLPLLMEKAGKVIVKLSPMLDWRKAVSDLSWVTEVHIVSVDNECKELVLVLEKKETQPLRLCCVNNKSVFQVFSFVENGVFPCGKRCFPWEKTVLPSGQSLYLFEPNASIMKAGCFAELEQRLGVCQLAANSHLFIADEDVEDFPGRRFHIEAVTTMNKQELKAALSGLERANIAVRNFPMSADQLRKKLKMKDGGDVFIFATTTSDQQHGQHKLFICRKIG